ncbi:MAG: ATP-binding protein [Actinomycetota bacterium]|nr:ATP-binding protein [Actinomycetota bacterium]
MTIVFTLCLPRDRASVPVVRHLLHSSMENLGVEDDCLSDIEIAVTEACTNVLQHSTGQEEYEVAVEVNEKMCEIRVTDTGQGFDHEGLAPKAPDTAESGRGIQLMKALVDKVRFLSRPEEGTIVHLEKKLSLTPDSVLRSFVAPAASR